MNLEVLIKQLTKKQHKIISLLAQHYKKLSLRLEVLVLSVLAAVINLFDRIIAVTETQISVQNAERGLTINCMGAVDMAGEQQYSCDLASVSELLEEADLSLASAMNDLDNEVSREITQILNQNKITMLSSQELVHGQVFVSPMGNVAVITYERSMASTTKKRIKLELMRYIQMVKRKNADFIVVYVKNSIKKSNISDKEIRLYKLLSQMGADYIVGVTPNRRDGGSTYQKQDGGIARSIYSLGTFLSSDTRLSNKRVVIRLKLQQIHGKLQLFEETYLPLYHVRNSGMVSLLQKSSALLSDTEIKKYCGEIENEMQRIRPANRILTVGKVAELINTPLPPEYQYLAEFSVGKVCARSFEVMPGDIFFFREPFEDPNDQERVSPNRRLRIARTAAKRGAMLLVTFRNLPFACRQILCSNVIEAHISVCSHLRQQFQMRTIGITGSIGKTSTKDMLAEVIRMQYNTVKSEQNSNVQVKIGLNIQKLNSNCDFYIQEIAGGRPGGTSRHARMVLPEVAVVTNIGDAHIGNFGSREKLMENKLQIIEGMRENGVLYLNGDDPLLATAKPKCKTIFYAVHNKNADYYVEDLTEENAASSFFIVHEGKRAHVKLNVIGDVNVLNAVCCYAIGKQFGIPEEAILQGLMRFRTTGIRQNLVNVCGRKFYMDCFNASTDSVNSAVETLCKIAVEPGKKRIAVIGDITGMGELTKEVHCEIGHILSRHRVDQIILFGESTKYTYEVLAEKGIAAYHTSDREKLNRLLRELVDVGDAAMFKGSSKMLLEYSVDMVYGTRMTDIRLVDENEYKRVRIGAISYNLFANYATVAKYMPVHSTDRKVQVLDNVGSIGVANVGRAFTDSNITDVILPETIRHLGDYAFMNCRQLVEIKLPSKLKFIGNQTFKNCQQLCQIEIPDGVLHVGREAFAGCTGLKKVVIPSSVVQIEEDAFAGCEKCCFVCAKDSYAAQYLAHMGICIHP